MRNGGFDKWLPQDTTAPEFQGEKVHGRLLLLNLVLYHGNGMEHMWTGVWELRRKKCLKVINEDGR